MGPSAERAGRYLCARHKGINTPWPAVGLRILMKLPFFSYVFIRGKHCTKKVKRFYLLKLMPSKI